MKWFDANGVDVDAYPEQAFRGGVYDGGIFGKGYRQMTIVHKSPHGLEFNVETVCSNKNMVKVSSRDYPNKVVEVPMSMDSFAARWRLWIETGQTVDEAFNELHITVRDFFQMGVHPSEWVEMFSGTDLAERHRDTPEYAEYLKNFPLSDPRD